jgi:hypothetical protein
MPAEASRVAPTWRTAGKVISASAAPSRMIPPCTTRLSTRVWVWIRRACRLSATSIGLWRRIEASTAPTMRTSSQVKQPNTARRNRCSQLARCSSGIGTARRAWPRKISGRAKASGRITACATRARLESFSAMRRA